VDATTGTDTAGRLLTPDELSALAPSVRKGRRTSPATIKRWMRLGLRGERLPYVMVGMQPCTTEESLMEFFRRLTLADEARHFVHVDEPATSPTQAAKAADRPISRFSQCAEELGL
jgi:hypothetical protein